MAIAAMKYLNRSTFYFYFFYFLFFIFIFILFPHPALNHRNITDSERDFNGGKCQEWGPGKRKIDGLCSSVEKLKEKETSHSLSCFSVSRPHPLTLSLF